MLSAYRRRLADAIRGRRDLVVADVARTMAERAESGDHTVAIRAATIPELVRELADEMHGDTYGATTDSGAPPPGRFVRLPPTPFDETHVDLPLAGAPDSPAPPARTPAREEIRAAFVVALGADDDGDLLGADFFEAGGESVMLVELVAELEGRYGCAIDFGALDAAGSVGELIDLLAAQIDNASAPEPVMLVRYGDWTRPGPRWLLHPPAGGTTLAYRRLAQELGDAPIGVFTSPAGLQPAGLQTIPEIAAAAIAALPPDVGGPLWLGGYSFGGSAAVETALQLERAGHTVAHVVLLDALAPESYGPPPDDPEDYARAAARVLDRFAGFGEADVPGFAERWRRHHGALAEYVPAGRISAPVTLLRAAEPERSGVFAMLGVDPVHDWSGYTSSPVTVVDVPGDHYSMLADEAHRASLLRAWRDALPAERPDNLMPPGPAQARLAATQLARPGDPSTNIGAVIEFGGLDPERLAAAIAAVATATATVNDTLTVVGDALARVRTRRGPTCRWSNTRTLRQFSPRPRTSTTACSRPACGPNTTSRSRSAGAAPSPCS
ncbi:hypothetical protein MTP03_30520 [Tsukamurella sp. PLM1]|nr:hypothetical protein MTP03_30520 [Tsukamurella sp. PLM1]